AGEEAAEFGEDLEEEVFASEVGDDALLDLAAVAVGFDDADVFMDRAAGGADFHGSRVHENHYHDELCSGKRDFWIFLEKLELNCHYDSQAGGGSPYAKSLENKAISHAPAADPPGFTSNMG